MSSRSLQSDPAERLPELKRHPAICRCLASGPFRGGWRQVVRASTVYQGLGIGESRQHTNTKPPTRICTQNRQVRGSGPLPGAFDRNDLPLAIVLKANFVIY